MFCFEVFRFLPFHRYHPFFDYNIAQIFTLFKTEFCTKLTLGNYIKRRNLVIMLNIFNFHIDIESAACYH